MNYWVVNFIDICVINFNVVVDMLMKDEYGFILEFGWCGFILKYFYIDVVVFYFYYGNKIGFVFEVDGVWKI